MRGTDTFGLEIGDRQGQGCRLNNLALAHACLGQHEDAVKNYTAAVKVFKAIRADAPDHERTGHAGAGSRPAA